MKLRAVLFLVLSAAAIGLGVSLIIHAGEKHWIGIVGVWLIVIGYKLSKLSGAYWQ